MGAGGRLSEARRCGAVVGVVVLGCWVVVGQRLDTMGLMGSLGRPQLSGHDGSRIHRGVSSFVFLRKILKYDRFNCEAYLQLSVVNSIFLILEESEVYNSVNVSSVLSINLISSASAVFDHIACIIPYVLGTTNSYQYP